MKAVLEEKIMEIVKFAQNNDNYVSYNVAMDILKDKEDISEQDILTAIEELGERKITIMPEEDEGYPAEETNPETFIPAEVNIGQRTVNVYNLMERLENEEIDLNPDFQRNGNLWSSEQQSRLIESLMLKIPIPAFYFNAANEAEWIVIDGLQRLTAFKNFLVGADRNNRREKQQFTGLQYLKDFNGLNFDELPRQYIRRIKETSVIAYTVEKGTPDEIVYNIFQRINTGGIVLEDQEIRQALYQGKVTELIERLAKSEIFLGATQNAIRPDRMLDREYVTRFLAFTELDYTKEYEGNIDHFLIKAMKLVNNYRESDIRRIEDKFQTVMGYCAEIFGKFAFRKYNRIKEQILLSKSYNENWRRGPINKAIFEMWSVCFSELTEEQLDKIVCKRKEFLMKFCDMQQDRGFITAIKAGDQHSTNRRIDMARNMLKEFV